MKIEYGLLYIFSVFIASCAQIILKQSANSMHENIMKEYFNLRVVIGYSLMGISLISGVFAYRGMQLKYAPILESSGYIFVFFLSWLFLNEKPKKNKIIGIGLIIIGITIAVL